MDILTRLKNLERFVFALSEKIDRNKFYGDADTAGAMQSISEKAPMPYTATQTAYIDDTEIVFEGVKEGNLSVYVKDKDGNYPDYKVERAGERVTVYFEPLKSITTVTITIL